MFNFPSTPILIPYAIPTQLRDLIHFFFKSIKSNLELPIYTLVYSHLVEYIRATGSQYS